MKSLKFNSPSEFFSSMYSQFECDIEIDRYSKQIDFFYYDCVEFLLPNSFPSSIPFSLFSALSVYLFDEILYEK